MESDVLFDIGFAGRDLALLGREDLAQLRDLCVADARRRKGGERGLDESAELDDVRNAVAAGDEAVERPGEIVRRDLADERAATCARLDDAEELERAQRLTDRGAGDLELVGERALRGQLVSRMELALLQERFDLLDDALIETASPDRLDRGQFPPSPVV